jgi:2'-5' RNA ligase
LRLFVAIEMPEEWHAALASMQRKLGELLETPQAPRLRWVRPEGMHLTLKFLGNISPDRLPEIEHALAQAVTSPPNVVLRLGNTGYFTGPRRSLRVLWIGVDGDTTALSALAGWVDAACAEIGFEAERRPFAPHLTLARGREDGAIAVDQTLVSRLQAMQVPALPPFMVERVSLMRSHLERGGARYERIASWPQAGQA